MKNAKLKIKNEGEDEKWGNGNGPMGPVRNAECGVRNKDVQSPWSKVDPVRNSEYGMRNFEFLRLKTSFGEEHGMENGKSRTTTRTKNRNDEGMAFGALRLILPPESCGRLGSPGKTPTSDVGAAEAGSKVCLAAGRARAAGKLFTDFHLFPLSSICFRSFDNKNIFPERRRLSGRDPGGRNLKLG